MPRRQQQQASGRGEDPTYVTPNDARGEPVYVNPTGDLADAENAIYERGAGETEGEPEYLTLKDDTGDTGDQPRYTALKVDVSEGTKAAREDGEGSEQLPVKEDVLAAGDSEIPKRLYQRITALESGFRKLSLTLGLMYLVNLALVIYIIAYQPLSQSARQAAKPEENLTFLKPVPPTPRVPPGESGGTEQTREAAMPRPDPPRGDAREPTTAPNSLMDFAFKSATFTTLGATGRAGPTNLSDHYRGQDHENLVTLQNGIQLFTVPETGDYEIEVAGAAGGVDSLTVNASARGHGALMRGTFPLIKGEVLKVLVGQQGAEREAGFSAGGGGGTFVTRLDNTPLIIAGGGGGIEWLDRRYESCDGTTLPSGQKSYKGAVGRPGNSYDVVFAGGSDGHGATDGKGAVGGGGGGLLTNGGSGREFQPRSMTSGGEGGYAFVNGGQGGRGLYYNTTGGFGGGGGAYGGSGGGGGYSGGGRGPTGACECGGGGGSFNAGTDTSGQNGTNAGPGYAVIVRLFG